MNRAISPPAVLLHITSEDGHRGSYLSLLGGLLNGARARGFWQMLLTPKPLCFLTLEGAFALYCLIAPSRALIGRRTVGLLLRPRPALTGQSLRLRIKRYILKWLRRLPQIQTLSILPFSVEPRFADIADGWIHDPQLWDLRAEKGSTEIKGEVLSRLVQLALRHIYSDQPAERFRELLELMSKVSRDPTALDILESLLRYYVQGTGRLDEPQVRRLLEQTLSGEPLMETFIDRYIAQGKQLGEQRGEAKILLHQIERKFGPPSAAVRERIVQAESDRLLEWSERILEARSLDEVLH